MLNAKEKIELLRTILVIEDDEDIQDVIEGFFRPRKFRVEIRSDSKSALGEIRDGKIHPDVILTDLRMPSMSGIEFTQAMKSMGMHVPIILMTAQQGSEVAVQAIEAGAYDFIVKPIHFPQLLVSVERALHFSKIHQENTVLKATIKNSSGPLEGVIGKSPGFLRAVDLAKRVSDSAANVFINGESGTGKEVIARAIHTFGQRRDKPFIAINCSAIPEALLESELFGYAKGAFTGAAAAKLGLFEEAEGGTLFLDEIGDLSLPLQAKLLRVLQERKIKRIGENQMRDIDVRVVSATHKNLLQEVAEKKFREDLFFRLNVIPILLPPLRDRKEDIVPLARFFLTKFSLINASKAEGFTKAALDRLLSYQWRGNVRELENKIERAVVLCGQPLIDVADLFDDEPVVEKAKPTEKVSNSSAEGMPLGPEGRLLTLDELETAYIKFALAKNSGAKDKTARCLGIDRKTLYKKIRDFESEESLPSVGVWQHAAEPSA